MQKCSPVIPYAKILLDKNRNFTITVYNQFIVGFFIFKNVYKVYDMNELKNNTKNDSTFHSIIVMNDVKNIHDL